MTKQLYEKNTRNNTKEYEQGFDEISYHFLRLKLNNCEKSLILNGFRAESVAWAGLGRISRIGFARRLFGARTCTDWPGLKWDTSEAW